MNKKIVTNSPDKTKKVGYIVGNSLDIGDVVCLNGNLGAGKTVFVQGFAQALQVSDYVTSPTFTIVNEYEGKIPFYHFDVYRINNVEEMFDIGFDSYIYGTGICVIEWAEKIKEILPDSYLQVNINTDINKGDNYREVHISSVGKEYEKLMNNITGIENEWGKEVEY